MLRIHRGYAGRQERHGDVVEQVVGSVADDDAFHRNTPLARQRGLEFEAGAVGIQMHFVKRAAHRGLGRLAAAERVLVRGQLDDVALGDTQLARHLRDRLAGLVGRDGAHIGWS